METSCLLDQGACIGEVYRLPMRDGNSNGLVVVRDCKSVYRLPMRDGNFGNPFETRIRIRVYRLPMRDGNMS